MASIVNVTLVEGSDTYRTWSIKSDGSPLNLASATVTCVIKPSEHYEDDDDAAHVLTEGDGVTVVSATDGTVRVDIPTAVTQAPGQWLYKITIGLSGDTDTAVYGILWIADA